WRQQPIEHRMDNLRLRWMISNRLAVVVLLEPTEGCQCLFKVCRIMANADTCFFFDNISIQGDDVIHQMQQTPFESIKSSRLMVWRKVIPCTEHFEVRPYYD